LNNKSMNIGVFKNLMRASAVWAVSFTVFSALAALIVSVISINEKSVSFISSAIVFISSAMVGTSLRRSNEKISYCIIFCFMIITFLLSAGFLVDSSRIETGGILSVSSFTLAGALSGYVLKTRNKKRSRIKLSS